jgi:uncharacterized delta-60 repeat protein
MDHFDVAEDVVLQPDGKIVLAGWTSTLETWVSAVARFDPDGSLDAGFGDGGKVFTSLRAADEASFGRAVALQPDGKILLAGGVGNLSGFALARYEPDGSLDPAFGVDGKLVTLFKAGNAYRWAEAYAVAVQPDGKIVAAGTSTDGFALARYLVTRGCVVPETVGLWLPEAKEAITVNGCSVGSIKRVFSRKVGRGFVISQHPPARATLAEADPVDLVVSKGKRRRR